MSEDAKKTEKEKIEERREEVLANGRKFKYPLQYTKHKLVIATVIIAVIATIGAFFAGYMLLYKAQDTGDVLYRLTRVVPVSVAKVDGEKVRYSDYLMIYRSSIMPIEQQTGTLGDDEDSQGRKNYYKREALTEAEKYTYAMKLAREQNVSVSDEEVTKAFDAHRKIGGTELSHESFLRILKDNFGMDESEYRRILELSLIREKVSTKIDTNSKVTAEEISQFLSANDNDFKKASEQFGEKVQYEETSGMVSLQNVDGGRAGKAYELEKGAVSSPFVSSNGDGYYIVKCIDKSESEVNYVSLFVEFKEFENWFNGVKNDGKVEEYIEIKQ